MATLKPTNKEIGERIRAIRKEKKLSQVELAANAKINVATLKRYERGERYPDFSILAKIAEQLNVPITYLYTGIRELGITKDPYDEIYYENTPDSYETIDEWLRVFLSNEIIKRNEAADIAQQQEDAALLDVALGAYFQNVKAEDVTTIFNGLNSDDIDELKHYADFLRSKKQKAK